MGLFDFAKDVGRQLFNTDAEAADNIREHLNIKLTGVKNLEVSFDDGVATLCGDCVNEATRDQAVLIAGDVKGVEKVVKRYYGKASLYTRIHEANKELIPDPNKIYPGQKIRIPLDS